MTRKALRTMVAVGILTAVVGSGTVQASVKAAVAAPAKPPVTASFGGGLDTIVEEDC